MSTEQKKGAFASSLKRNNRQIRDDRAQAIVEDTMLLFKREVEDIQLGITRMKRERDNMLDLSPTNAQSLVLASEFDAKAYVSKEKSLATKIRNEEILIGLMNERFIHLFEAEEEREES